MSKKLNYSTIITIILLITNIVSCTITLTGSMEQSIPSHFDRFLRKQETLIKNNAKNDVIISKNTDIIFPNKPAISFLTKDFVSLSITRSFHKNELKSIGSSTSKITTSPPTAGDWILSTSNNFTGGTFIINGSLIINSPNNVTFMNCNLIINGTLELQTSNHLFVNNNITMINTDLLQAIILSSDRQTFINNTITGTTNLNNPLMNGKLILFYLSSYNSFINNTIINYGNHYGIEMYGSSTNNEFVNNTITSQRGIIIDEAPNNNWFIGNSITATVGHGLELRHDVQSNYFRDNYIRAATTGIIFGGNGKGTTFVNNTIVASTEGIYLYSQSKEIIFINNSIKHYNPLGSLLYGIHLSGVNVSNNYLTGNRLTNCQIGIFITENSSDNFFNSNFINPQFTGVLLTNSHENFFIRNEITKKIEINEEGINNLFFSNYLWEKAVDNGINNSWSFYGIGNFWKEYAGLDLNNDGIGDLSFSLDGTSGSVDNYPLMLNYLNITILSRPPNLNLSGSIINVELVWMLANHQNHKFNVFLNGNEIRAGICEIDKPIAFQLDSLVHGEYNFTIRVEIDDNEFLRDTVIIIVNNQPSIRIVYPNGGETLTDTVIINWQGSDNDSDDLRFSLYYSTNNGSDKTVIATNLVNQQYSWDTSTLPNNESYIIILAAFDGYCTVYDSSDDVFSVNNPNYSSNSPFGLSVVLILVIAAFYRLRKYPLKKIKEEEK